MEGMQAGLVRGALRGDLRTGDGCQVLEGLAGSYLLGPGPVSRGLTTFDQGVCCVGHGLRWTVGAVRGPCPRSESIKGFTREPGLVVPHARENMSAQGQQLAGLRAGRLCGQGVS